MGKHAFLIMAHNQFDLLEMLIKLLDDAENDFYIHIDAKVKNFDFQYFSALPTKSNLVFTERNKVSWGGYSQIDTELLLLKAATPGQYDYYHLLSGVDLPLKSNEYIHQFFEDHQGKEFLHFCTMEYTSKASTLSRIQQYHFLQEKVGRKEKGPLKFMERASLKLQRILKVNRLKSLDSTPYCGANWFSITHDFATFVLQKEDYIRKHFKLSFCADEMFLHTLILDSPFAENLYLKETEDNYESCLRYIDWKRGTPYIFKTEDFDDLMSSPYLFARKFDLSVDSNICSLIFNKLKQ